MFELLNSGNFQIFYYVKKRTFKPCHYNFNRICVIGVRVELSVEIKTEEGISLLNLIYHDPDDLNIRKDAIRI
jgi:hypothetical protein